MMNKCFPDANLMKNVHDDGKEAAYPDHTPSVDMEECVSNIKDDKNKKI